MTIGVWFEPTTAGEYELACAELCGLGHYSMNASVTVHETGAFESWVSEEGVQAPAVETPAPADTSTADVEAATAASPPSHEDHSSHQPASEGKERA
jgi:cytochrome c oxidase subunit 2